MIRAACAYLFGVHFLFPDQPWWVAVTLANVAMMLWLAGTSRQWQPGFYMAFATISSLFRASPLWTTHDDFVLAFFACAFGYSLVPRGSHRVCAVGIGVALVGVLAAAGVRDWPGYSSASYHARIYPAVGLLAASVACVTESWVRGKAVDWRAVIAVPWFAVWFLTLAQWRTDVNTHAYWVQYWHIALAGKVAWAGCLAGWIKMGRKA